jgi:hypothetical protein
MNPTMRSLAILVTSTVAGFGSTLLCAWPSATNAQGAGAVLAEQGAVGARASKLGPLVAASHVIAAGGHCIVETRVRNPSGERVESAPIEAELYRTVSSPMARVAPMPTKVWQAAHVVSVEPGQEVALRDELGPALCAQIIRPASDAPKDNGSPIAMQPVTSFHTAVVGPQPPAAVPHGVPQHVVLGGDDAPPVNAPLAVTGPAPGARQWAAPPPPRADAVPQRKVRMRTGNGSPASARQRKPLPSPSYPAPVAQQAQVQQRSGG